MGKQASVIYLEIANDENTNPPSIKLGRVSSIYIGMLVGKSEKRSKFNHFNF